MLGGDEPRDVDVDLEVDTVSLEAQYENMLEGMFILVHSGAKRLQ